MELDFWMNKIQDTWRQNTGVEDVCSKCFIACLSYLFLYILTSKFIKKLKKKNKQAKKIQILDLAESNAHRKTNARGSFETYDLFF